MKTKRFRIYGQVRESDSKRGLAGLEIRALDKDLCFDDRLGTAITDKKGKFEIHYDRSDFGDFFETRPDIYLRVRAPDMAVLYTTEDRVRYQADDTERFLIELPDTAERIVDGETLRRRIVSNPALQQELAEAVSGLLAGKDLLDPALAYTFVPLVAEKARLDAELFVDKLGPQPEPPDKRWAQLGPQPIPPDLAQSLGPDQGTPQPDPPNLPMADQGHWVNPQPEPPTWVRQAVFEPDPEPWCVRWWWIGLPEIEFLRRLDDFRIADLTEREGSIPARNAASFAYRIMADRTLVRSLSRKIEGILGRHGVVLAAGLDYSFVPVVYPRPDYGAQLLAPAAAMPQIIDRAGQTSPPLWVHPLEGLPPAELLVALAGLRAQQAHS
jgi:hypothetical protein